MDFLARICNTALVLGLIRIRFHLLRATLGFDFGDFFLGRLFLLLVGVVSLLLILVSLLVGSGLGLVRSTLLLVESLPSLTEELADLTERDTRVLLTDVLTLLVGEEHVGGETTLGGVGVLLGTLGGSSTTLSGGSSLRHFECVLRDGFEEKRLVVLM
jgi:hypothetical protein